MNHKPIRVRDSWSGFEAVQIIENDLYKIRPMIGHGVEYVLDVGANAGAFTIAAANAFPDCKIIAIEPNRELVDDITENTRHVNNVTIIHAAAVGPGCGDSVEFLRVPGALFASRLIGCGNPITISWDKIMVPAVRLSSVLEQRGFPRVDVLKIDAEGAEGGILMDLAETGWIAKVQWIRGEWHNRNDWPTIRKALNPTHDYALEDNPDNGELIAHRRLDER